MDRADRGYRGHRRGRGADPLAAQGRFRRGFLRCGPGGTRRGEGNHDPRNRGRRSTGFIGDDCRRPGGLPADHPRQCAHLRLGHGSQAPRWRPGRQRIQGGRHPSLQAEVANADRRRSGYGLDGRGDDARQDHQDPARHPFGLLFPPPEQRGELFRSGQQGVRPSGGIRRISGRTAVLRQPRGG